MTDLALIVPTRGRPERFREMINAVAATAETPVTILAGVDDDDDIDAYKEVAAGAPGYVDRDMVIMQVSPRLRLSPKTNQLAQAALDYFPAMTHLASLGDDHRPRTRGWDVKLMAAADQVDGWAYGNDLLQGAQLPTAWVVRSGIVRALGWLMLPTCQHLYVDNAVLELGRRTRRIAFAPSVIVEHQHPLSGRADWDDSYRESNGAERHTADKAAYEAWLADGIVRDIAAIGVR